MSRLFVFLLGVLVGAAGMHYLFEDGSRSANNRTPSQAAQESVALPPDASMKIDPLPLPNAPVPSLPDSSPVAIEPPVEQPGTAPDATETTPALLNPEPAPPTPPVSHDLLIPVAGVSAAQLSDTFTQARGTGRLHDAIDIMAPRGTQVLAVDDGKVVKLFTSKQGGLTVYQFDRDGKLAYYYAHLDSYAPGVVEGKQLKRGDLVGFVGSTGNASPDGPHLHFAIFVLGPEKNWWKGTAINPYPLLGGRQ